MANETGTSGSSRKPSEAVAAFYARGEQAWQAYLRTGVSATVDEVFERLHARIADHKAKLLAQQPGRPSLEEKQR